MDCLIYLQNGFSFSGCDRCKFVSIGIGHFPDGLSSAFRLQDRCLFLTFGDLDCRFPLTVGFQNHCTPDTFRLHLTVHGLHHIRRRFNALYLDPDNPNSPSVCGVIEDHAQLGINYLAGGKGFIEYHFANYVTQVGLSQLGCR